MKQPAIRGLVAANLALAGLALGLWLGLRHPGTTPQPLPLELGSLPTLSLTSPPPESLQAILERPLFSPTRQPAPATSSTATPGTPAASSDTADFLVGARVGGIAQGRNGASVILMRGNESRRVRSGQAIGRWRLHSLTAGSARFVSEQGEIRVLNLQRGASSTPPPANNAQARTLHPAAREATARSPEQKPLAERIAERRARRAAAQVARPPRPDTPQ